MAYFQEARPTNPPAFNAPASVLILIAVLVGAHVVRTLLPAHTSEEILYTYALDASVYFRPASWFQRVVPPFTHMFLHGGYFHLAVNCVWLLAFGPVVARRFGGPVFLLFFVLCGLAGAAAFVLLAWGDVVGAIGASGAISGLMGGAIRMMRINQPYLNVATLPLEPLFSRPVVMFSAVWLAINFVTGIFVIGAMGTVEAIAWQDHMGGYIAGLLLAGPFEQAFGLAAKQRRPTA
ncbi:MAG: rhomboid family intramembrane serine protease [Alphaproteobacteria bacterium]|nr:rhomboid family intramembrane serine protease [Alphaproteobacteria bacterium]MBV9902977.1 rhomboid family intramembrane serine protease [Alphaproteobacteria bacterium]